MGFFILRLASSPPPLGAFLAFSYHNMSGESYPSNDNNEYTQLQYVYWMMSDQQVISV